MKRRESIEERPEPTAAMRSARRALEEIQGCKLVEDLHWYDSEACWALLFELNLGDDVPAHPELPQVTRWYALLEQDYPQGRISIHPACAGGISATFPHQSYNGPARDDRPWRSGRLCLDEPIAALDRIHLTTEPMHAARRLAYHVRRAQDWLAAALRGDLLRCGDPFELPDFDEDSQSVHLVHAEDEARLALWRACSARAGTVQLHAVTIHGRRHMVAIEFLAGPACIIAGPQWGNGMRLETATRMRGGWILLPAAPIVAPWQAPKTWGQLRTCARTMGADLDALLEGALKPLAGAAAPVVLVGFPIPARVDGNSVEIHWQPLRLPSIPPRSRRQRAMRRRPTMRSPRAPLIESIGLSDRSRLDWGTSENWSSTRLGSRGRLRPPLCDRSVAVIGVGALGSLVAELLARGGVTSITLIDGERLAAGNLVRHTLGISDIGDKKATAVARRLLEASPHARVKRYDDVLPGDAAKLAELLGEVDIVIDCTADDGVLDLLGSIHSHRDQRWISVSLGFEGRRLYVFDADGRCFPTERFRRAIEPWIRSESAALEERELPRNGPGCWHPLFPARHDAVMMMAALAVNEIDARGTDNIEAGQLRVIRAVFDDSGRLVRVEPEREQA